MNKEDNIFGLVAEDLLRDFTLEELLEELNVDEVEALSLVLEVHLYDPDVPGFIQARVMEFEEKQYTHAEESE